MRSGDVSGSESVHPERTMPVGELAPPLQWRATLPEYSGGPLQRNGYLYWAMPEVGIVRAPGHRVEDYEVVVRLEEVPWALGMDVARGLIYWMPLEQDVRTDVSQGKLQCGVLADEGHRLVEWREVGRGLSQNFEGLTFGGLGNGVVGVYSIDGGIQWSESLEMEVTELTTRRLAVSVHHRRAILLDTEYKLHGWDVDTGERLFQVRLEDQGLAGHFHQRDYRFPLARGERMALDEGCALMTNHGLAIYDDLAIADIQHSVTVAFDTATGRLVWSKRGGGQLLVTDDGRVVVVRQHPWLKGVDYRELDARTGKTLVRFRNCRCGPDAGGDSVNPGEAFDAYMTDVTRTHCWVTGDQGSVYAINRATGSIDWWWQDPDDYGAAFAILIWEGTLFLYGSPLIGPGGPRTHLFEPAG